MTHTTNYPAVYKERGLEALLMCLEHESGMNRENVSEQKVRQLRAGGDWKERTLAYAVQSPPLSDEEIGAAFDHDGFAALVVLSRDDVIFHPQTLHLLKQHLRSCSDDEKELFSKNENLYKARWEAASLKARVGGSSGAELNSANITRSPAL